MLVTFPAASTIFTDPDEYDLSNTQYGLLFVPQVVTAIAASLLGAALARRFGTKRIYLAGLAAGLTSMALLISSTLVESDTAVAFPLLLVATAFLGVGFGLTVPALNTLTAAFHPERVESSVLVLNALWFGDPHPTHFNVEEALAVAEEIGAERTYLTHLTHRVGHSALEQGLPPGVHPAYDGLVVEV